MKAGVLKLFVIEAGTLDFRALNDQLRAADTDCRINGCLGQRFIGACQRRHHLDIYGIPGNALGAYLGGAEITVHGNAQDAVGDTMNSGKIIIHGSVGDAAGYAMRGGEIYVEGSAGYRTGIHMKAYREKKPAIIIGGRAGSFLGEYQAGGLILVLGLHTDGKPIVTNFPCTGMHGGKLILRGTAEGILFPDQTTRRAASAEDLAEIEPYIRQYCTYFDRDAEQLLRQPYTVVTPDSKNPYRQMYVEN